MQSNATPGEEHRNALFKKPVTPGPAVPGVERIWRLDLRRQLSTKAAATSKQSWGAETRQLIRGGLNPSAPEEQLDLFYLLGLNQQKKQQLDQRRIANMTLEIKFLKCIVFQFYFDGC